MTLTEEQISELERLEQEASSAPWGLIQNALQQDCGVCDAGNHNLSFSGGGPFDPPGEESANARLVIAMRNALLALIAAAREGLELKARLARAEEILDTLEDMEKWQGTPQMGDALNVLAHIVLRKDANQ